MTGLPGLDESPIEDEEGCERDRRACCLGQLGEVGVVEAAQGFDAGDDLGRDAGAGVDANPCVTGRLVLDADDAVVDDRAFNVCNDRVAVVGDPFDGV